MRRCIIPIFIPHYGCSHECIFCNQNKITGVTEPVRPSQVAEKIDNYLETIDCHTTFVELAFYGGSFTALSADVQCSFLQPAYQALVSGKIDSIRLSTRPDCIDEDTIARLKKYHVSTVELGVQSFDDVVLRAANRGHTALDALNAVRLLKKAGLTFGVQLMLGLPVETWQSLMKTIERTVQCQPDFIRLYPAVVLTPTTLADMYRQGRFQPLSLNEAVRRCAYIKLVCESNHIPVIRTGLQATHELDDPDVVIAGPYHPAFGELVDSYIYYLLVAHVFEQIGLPPDSSGDQSVIHFHPREQSKVRGMKNRNIMRWNQEYGIACKLQGDLDVMNTIMIEAKHTRFIINKSMLFHI